MFPQIQAPYKIEEFKVVKTNKLKIKKDYLKKKLNHGAGKEKNIDTSKDTSPKVIVATLGEDAKSKKSMKSM